MICPKCKEELKYQYFAFICNDCNLGIVYKDHSNKDFFQLYIFDNTGLVTHDVLYDGEVTCENKTYHLNIKISCVEEAFSVLEKLLNNLMFE